jgi:hypothetical protein
MNVLLLTAILAIVPVELVARDSCETLEQSFFYDFEGRLVFEQLIVWDQGDVVAWRLVRDGQPRIERDHKHGGYVCRWKDGEVYREVRSQFEMVTHEQFDRELEARERLPVERRRGLRNH